MSDEELAGQLLMLGFTGREPAAAEEAMALKPAGFSLLPRNLIDAAQTAALARGLQEAAVRAGLAPLFIAADQEGGAVTAVAEGATVFPGAMALGAAGSPALTRRMARAQGREAAAMGINLNYAPVADVNTDPENPIIGVRSFGDDPAAVGRHVAAAARGYQESGVLAAAKHFPGHGATRVDSHLGLSILDTAPAVLERRELAPFRAAVGAGAGAVMTAHIVYTALDPDRPATLSPAAIRGLLRERLGFRGLVLTDCLEMEAVAARYGPEEYAVLAVEAGADLLLISHTPARQTAARDALVDALRRRRLPRDRVRASVARTLAAKERLGLYQPKRRTPDLEEIRPRHGRLEEEVARRAITPVKDEGLLPLANAARTAVIWPEVASRPRIGDPEAVCPLGRAVRRYCPDATEVRFPAVPGQEDIARILRAAEEAEVIIAATAGARPPQSAAQTALVQALIGLGKPTAVLALRNPYDLVKLSGARVLLAAYDAGPAAVRAAVDVLYGRARAKGRLPVELGFSVDT